MRMLRLSKIFCSSKVAFKTLLAIGLCFAVTLVSGCIGNKKPALDMTRHISQVSSFRVVGKLVTLINHQNGCLPVLYDNNKLVFCLDDSLQIPIHSLDIGGDLKSWDIKITADFQYLAMTVDSHNRLRLLCYQIPKNFYNLEPTRDGFFNQQINAFIKKIMDETRIVCDVTIDGDFDTRIIDFYQTKQDLVNDLIVVCQSERDETLYFYNILGDLISSMDISKEMVFAPRNFNSIDTCAVGFDGSTINYFNLGNGGYELERTESIMTTQAKDYFFPFTKQFEYGKKRDKAWPYCVLSADGRLTIIDKVQMNILGEFEVESVETSIGYCMFKSRNGTFLIYPKDGDIESYWIRDNLTLKHIEDLEFDVYDFSVIRDNLYFYVNSRVDGRFWSALSDVRITDEALTVSRYQLHSNINSVDYKYILQKTCVTDSKVYKINHDDILESDCRRYSLD